MLRSPAPASPFSLPDTKAGHRTFIGITGLLRLNPAQNEITAIPELIKALALEGAIVSIDAMGVRKKSPKRLSAQEPIKGTVITSPEATCTANALSQRRSTVTVSAGAHTAMAPTSFKMILKTT